MDSNLFNLTWEPIDVQQVIDKVVDRNCGAITTFLGTVREMTAGKKTLQLNYQAYEPMAVKMLAQIGDDVQGKWPGLTVAVTHRLGTLDISDVAVVVAVSSPHRGPAYEANAYIMERIKDMVPIWKKEFWEDGTQWIGDQRETTPYNYDEEGNR